MAATEKEDCVQIPRRWPCPKYVLDAAGEEQERSLDEAAGEICDECGLPSSEQAVVAGELDRFVNTITLLAMRRSNLYRVAPGVENVDAVKPLGEADVLAIAEGMVATGALSRGAIEAAKARLARR